MGHKWTETGSEFFDYAATLSGHESIDWYRDLNDPNTIASVEVEEGRNAETQPS